MKITTIGIELAKIIFQAHGVNEYGKVARCYWPTTDYPPDYTAAGQVKPINHF